MSLKTTSRDNLNEQLAGLSRRINRLEARLNINRNTAVTFGTAASNVDFTDLQEAIDYVSGKGGGVIFVRNGTYVFTSDIEMKSDVALMGEGFGLVIFYFVGSYSLKAVGSDAYSTGTVSINKGSTTLTGSGTSWDGAITTSHSIVLNEWIYTVSEVVSDTEITLGSAYTSEDLSGASYQAAVFISNIVIEKILVTNSDTHGIDFQYVDLGYFDRNYTLSNGGKGFSALHFHRSTVNTLVSQNNTGINIDVDEAYVSWFNWMATLGGSSHGVKINKANKSIVDNGVVDYSNNYGLYLTNTERMLIGRMSCDNGSYGMYIDNLTNCTFHAAIARNNTNDGFYITGAESNTFQSISGLDNGRDGIRIDADSDKNRLINSALTGNTGYGAKINNANCDKNLVAHNDLTGNTAGTLSDSGTGTVSANNIT